MRLIRRVTRGFTGRQCSGRLSRTGRQRGIELFKRIHLQFGLLLDLRRDLRRGFALDPHRRIRDVRLRISKGKLQAKACTGLGAVNDYTTSMQLHDRVNNCQSQTTGIVRLIT